jgi:hypothetical protein
MAERGSLSLELAALQTIVLFLIFTSANGRTTVFWLIQRECWVKS